MSDKDLEFVVETLLISNLTESDLKLSETDDLIDTITQIECVDWSDLRLVFRKGQEKIDEKKELVKIIKFLCDVVKMKQHVMEIVSSQKKSKEKEKKEDVKKSTIQLENFHLGKELFSYFLMNVLSKFGVDGIIIDFFDGGVEVWLGNPSKVKDKFKFERKALVGILERIKKNIELVEYKTDLSVVDKIREWIKKKVNMDGNDPKDGVNVINTANVYDENYFFGGDNEINSFMCDSFLYNKEERKKMLKSGKIPKFYCPKCQKVLVENVKNCKKCNNKIEERSHVSNSLSLLEIQTSFRKIYDDIAKSNKYLTEKVFASKKDKMKIVDIGSRLGNNLFFAYYFSKGLPFEAEIFGVEIDKFFVGLSNSVVEKFDLDKKKITFVNDDIANQEKLLKQCDVVIFFNPFSEFPREKHESYLKFVRKALSKPGTYFIVSPGFQDILDLCNLKIEEFAEENINKWLKEIWRSTDNDLFVYQVK